MAICKDCEWFINNSDISSDVGFCCCPDKENTKGKRTPYLTINKNNLCCQHFGMNPLLDSSQYNNKKKETNMANWESIFNKVVPAVTVLAKLAEKMFTTPKSGAIKKKFVHEGVMKLFEEADQITTGGANHTVKVLEKNLPDLIDVTASIIFNSIGK